MPGKSNLSGDDRENGETPNELAFSRGLAHMDTLCSDYPRNKAPVAAIRRKCLDCVCGNRAEVARCHIVACPLWPYRMGRNPFHAKAKP